MQLKFSHASHISSVQQQHLVSDYHTIQLRSKVLSKISKTLHDLAFHKPCDFMSYHSPPHLLHSSPLALSFSWNTAGISEPLQQLFFHIEQSSNILTGCYYYFMSLLICPLISENFHDHCYPFSLLWDPYLALFFS